LLVFFPCGWQLAAFIFVVVGIAGFVIKSLHFALSLPLALALSTCACALKVYTFAFCFARQLRNICNAVQVKGSLLSYKTFIE